MPLGRSANLPIQPLLSLRSAQQRGGFSLCAGGRRQFHRGRPLIACTTARSCSALRSISAKTWGLSRNCSLLSHKTRLLFRPSSHLFLPSPFQCAEQVAGLSHSTPFSRHCSPCASVHLSFAHRRLTIRQHVAPFCHTHAEVFFVFLTAQRQKTTTSKHILTEYIRHDTYFLSFLSLTDKKVVHLQRIDK